MFWGLVLITIGLAALFNVNWSLFWPLLLVVLGGMLPMSAVLGRGRSMGRWLSCNCLGSWSDEDRKSQT